MTKLISQLGFLQFCILTLSAQQLEERTITDIDGTIYRTVIIGNYEWMTENLRTTAYNSGVEIPEITENISWTLCKTGAYCWYNNNESHAETYGGLYNTGMR